MPDVFVCVSLPSHIVTLLRYPRVLASGQLDTTEKCMHPNKIIHNYRAGYSESDPVLASPGVPSSNVPVAENRVTYAVIGNWAEIIIGCQLYTGRASIAWSCACGHVGLHHPWRYYNERSICFGPHHRETLIAS